MNTNINRVKLGMYGFICPTESTEGPKCGITKSFTASYLNKNFTQNIHISKKYTKRQAK
ncbi:hypothetical protein [Acanthamoeba polyphaga mimivirus]|uniref:DNA-directed RNA polymerase n=2 Tax=Megamimivirinae TaxID=3044648 RepID=A0A2L2DK96_MIMIV|nr:hypothetical protein MegaChil _gp0860 [Megavirus chiliensis]AEQ32870.1 DNA-directed RNA polymerase subunit rpb2 domain 3 containing protein [Megavirus chiliensis]AVG46585.1 hypothetical protein [Acanthamoeba polyphaga mimivirus]AVG47695.1 hypothetical protein [Acanthamoeba polyphaga mimivirus]